MKKTKNLEKSVLSMPKAKNHVKMFMRISLNKEAGKIFMCLQLWRPHESGVFRNTATERLRL